MDETVIDASTCAGSNACIHVKLYSMYVCFIFEHGQVHNEVTLDTPSCTDSFEEAMQLQQLETNVATSGIHFTSLQPSSVCLFQTFHIFVICGHKGWRIICHIMSEIFHHLFRISLIFYYDLIYVWLTAIKPGPVNLEDWGLSLWCRDECHGHLAPGRCAVGARHKIWRSKYCDPTNFGTGDLIMKAAIRC